MTNNAVRRWCGYDEGMTKRTNESAPPSKGTPLIDKPPTPPPLPPAPKPPAPPFIDERVKRRKKK
ncbi:MAG TPA: hypothetical protein VGB79_01640 [Allosphingosinicella sp.]|jgi:hypothetical protein